MQTHESVLQYRHKRDLKTLAYIVASVMTDLNVSDEKHYIRFLKWAIDGYRKLNLHSVMPTVKTVYLEIDKNTNSAPLPTDYIDYLKIGLCINGYVMNFDLNKDICLAGEEKCPCDSSAIEADIQGISSRLNTSELTDMGLGLNANVAWTYMDSRVNNGFYTAGVYGVGSGYYGGGYRIDIGSGRIVFDSYIDVDKILLEYRSSGIADDGTAFVQDGAIEALTSWVHYQRCKFSTNQVDRQMVNEHKQSFQNAAMSMVLRDNALTESEWLYLMRKNIHQGVKR